MDDTYIKTYSEIDKQNKVLTKRLHDKNESVTALQVRIEELEGKSNRYCELEGRLEALRGIRGELETKLSERDDRIKNLCQNLASVWAKNKYLRKRAQKFFDRAQQLREETERWYERAMMHVSKEKALQRALDIKYKQFDRLCEIKGNWKRRAIELETQVEKTWACKQDHIDQLRHDKLHLEGQLTAEEKRASGELGHHYCREKVEALKRENEKLIGQVNERAALESKIKFLRKLIKALVGDGYESLNIANNLANNRLTSIESLEKKIKGLEWSNDHWLEECRRLRQDITELRK